MKKGIALTLTVLILLTFASCGKKAEETTPTVPATTEAPAPAETIATPTVPVSAPQTAPTVQNTQPVSYPTNAAPVVPTAVPQYDLEMLAKAGTALIDAGKIGELMALLGKYGIEALTSLDPSKYGVFASELRALGASI